MIREAAVRDARIETDCPAIAALVNSLESEPVTVAEVRRWFEHTPPGRISSRHVAVDPAGTIVGYSVVVHEAWRLDGDFYAWVGVLPSWQRKGIGSALFEEVEAFLASR